MTTLVLRPALLPALVLALIAGAAGAQTRTRPPGFTVTPVLDNAATSVVRLVLEPGAREEPHTHPYAMLVVVLSNAEMEMHNGASHTRGARVPGDLEFVAAGTSHFAGNVGASPLALLVLAIKPDRVHGAAAAPPMAMPGLSRAPLLDNAEVRVTKLKFESDVREPVHTHPYDMLIVPITPAHMDAQVGGRKQVRAYAIGDAIWIPRMTPHAFANVGTPPFRVLGITIK